MFVLIDEQDQWEWFTIPIRTVCQTPLVVQVLLASRNYSSKDTRADIRLFTSLSTVVLNIESNLYLFINLFRGRASKAKVLCPGLVPPILLIGTFSPT
jgi:hypothetical protein